MNYVDQRQGPDCCCVNAVYIYNNHVRDTKGISELPLIQLNLYMVKSVVFEVV